MGSHTTVYAAYLRSLIISLNGLRFKNKLNICRNEKKNTNKKANSLKTYWNDPPNTHPFKYFSASLVV